jgi:2-dehydro-3-deoxygluconokinase
MSAARALGLEVSLDVNLRPSLWLRSEIKAREALAPLLRHASVIFAGVDDWSACFDGAAPQDERDTATRRFLERMLEIHPDSKAIISGQRSSSGADDHDLSACAIVRGEGFVQARTVHIRNAVDRIGAGDAMVAGCIWNLLRNSPWQRTLDFGVMAGALKHTVPGDVSRISCEEIEAALAGADGGRLRR